MSGIINNFSQLKISSDDKKENSIIGLPKYKKHKGNKKISNNENFILRNDEKGRQATLNFGDISRNRPKIKIDELLHEENFEKENTKIKGKKGHISKPFYSLFRNGKRIFDRRSGTGRGREISKQGAGGKTTWGNLDQLAKQESIEYMEQEKCKIYKMPYSTFLPTCKVQDKNLTVEATNHIWKIDTKIYPISEENEKMKAPQDSTFTYQEYLDHLNKINGNTEFPKYFTLNAIRNEDKPKNSSEIKRSKGESQECLYPIENIKNGKKIKQKKKINPLEEKLNNLVGNNITFLNENKYPEVSIIITNQNHKGYGNYKPYNNIVFNQH